MPMQELEHIRRPTKKYSTNNHLPTIIKWKGVNMIRQESILAAAKEIIKWGETKDITKIGLVGEEDSGKTSLAETLSHIIHKESKLEWVVRKFYEKELMDFKETLKTLTPANHILIFDDVSFLSGKHGKKSIEQVKESVTKIRHLPGGKDVKIILIYNYHYTKGLDKYLRQAHFRFFTTIGSEEEENMEDIVGSRNSGLIKYFSRSLQQGVIKDFFPSPARVHTSKKKFFYKYRDPFIPVLFWNNSTLRMIISPLRQWIQPICSICSDANGEATKVDIAEFCDEFEKAYPKWSVTIVKQFLKERGINCYSKNMVSGRRFLDRALETKVFNLDDLAVHLGLTQTVTRLRKKPKDFASLQ